MIDSTFLTVIFLIISIILSMTFHEATHAYVSHFLGDDTAKHEDRLTINPLKHIDPFTTVLLPVILVILGLPPFGAAKPVPFNFSRVKWSEFGVALIGVSGPLSNLLMAIVASSIINLTSASGNLYKLLYVFTTVNVSFFIFNMIPFPPLDGSRLLYAFSPDKIREIMEKIESFGFLAIGMFVFFVFPILQPIFINLNTRLLNILL